MEISVNEKFMIRGQKITQIIQRNGDSFGKKGTKSFRLKAKMQITTTIKQNGSRIGENECRKYTKQK